MKLLRSILPLLLASCSRHAQAFVPAGPSTTAALRVSPRAVATVPETETTATKEQQAEGAAPTASDSSVTFPPPLSKVDRLGRAVTFWSTAIPIVASYYGLITRLKLQQLLNNTPQEDSLAEEEELWQALHADGAAKLADTITSLKGFYVKTAQIISTRQDLFPVQYTDALSGFTDNLDPMPLALVKAVIETELLHDSETFDDIFAAFDEEPLGAASIAQVHRAVLTQKYGGKEIAVKVQRPSIESKLLGDIANLKAIAKTFRNNKNLPLDYYTVFSELEKQLADEFDFVAEAVAMDRIYQGLVRGPDGSTRDLPVVIPRPVPGLVSRRVLCMDYLKGVPLSRAREEMQKRGYDPDSPEAKLFGRRVLESLTAAFGRSILETGFFHADPHPGNIFVLDDGRIGLIDFGQVKQISGRARETLCKVMVAMDDNVDLQDETNLERIGQLALELGVELRDTAPPEAAAAVAIWCFDGSVTALPGGYDTGELSPNSPVKELKVFPQDLVLVGRSSILIKGVANRLGISWGLAKEWAPIARQVLDSNYANVGNSSDSDDDDKATRVRFKSVWNTFKQWTKGRATKVLRRLPAPVRTRLAAAMVKRQEAKSRRALTKQR